MIELLIVLGIIGILTVMAIPVYQNYVVRARVIEGFSLVGTAKLAVADYAASTGQMPANQAAANYTSPAATDNVQSITIAGDQSGNIVINYTESAGGGSIILSPAIQDNREIRWDCTQGTLDDKFRPAVCR